MGVPSHKVRLFVSLLMLFCLLPLGAAQAQLPDFTSMVEKYGPAVVNISTKQKSVKKRFHGEQRMPELPEGSPFDEFFRHFFGDQLGEQFGDGGEGGQPDALSLGSGFIISADGYVITNHHVVEDADEILVRLSDRREFQAKLVGSDKPADTALLKIEAQGLPVVKIGKSSKAKVGEWVLAIGTPFGFDHSVTAGIISALGRSLPSENYVPFIQTDVAINPGNSGGPLFNLDGEVIGVNSQIYSRSGGFMGLSFAIPIEMAMNVADQLRSKGRVARGYLGVLIQDVTQELAESFGMDSPRGALVAKVLPGGPAEAAGVKTGDVILQFNGKQILRSGELPPMVGATPVDQQAELLVLRNGKERKLNMKITELPPEDGAVVAKSDTPRGKQADLLGLEVAEITDEQRKRWELPEGGVLVRQVLAGAARNGGIREGDVVLMINNQRVSSIAEYRQEVERLPRGKTVALLVQRQSGSLFVTVKVPAG